MELRNFLISVIIFSLVITLLAAVTSDLGNKYGITIDDENWNDTYSELGEMYEEVKTMQEQIEGTETGTIEGGRTVGMIKGAWAVIMMPFRTIRLLFSSGGVLYSFAEDYGVPLVAIQALLSILGITIIFAIASAVFRWRT